MTRFAAHPVCCIERARASLIGDTQCMASQTAGFFVGCFLQAHQPSHALGHIVGQVRKRARVLVLHHPGGVLVLLHGSFGFHLHRAMTTGRCARAWTGVLRRLKCLGRSRGRNSLAIGGLAAYWLLTLLESRYPRQPPGRITSDARPRPPSIFCGVRDAYNGGLIIRRPQSDSGQVRIPACRPIGSFVEQDENLVAPHPRGGEFFPSLPSDAATESARTRVHGYGMPSARRGKSSFRIEATLRRHEPERRDDRRSVLPGTMRWRSRHVDQRSYLPPRFHSAGGSVDLCGARRKRIASPGTRASHAWFGGGPVPALRAATGRCEEARRDQGLAGVIAQLKASGLAGLGGAGFPTGMKWETVRNAPGTEKYVICNADESEPGTIKDRFILEHLPHLVAEGMIIAGLVTGAKRGIMYIRHEYHLQEHIFREEIEHAREIGAVGRTSSGRA